MAGSDVRLGPWPDGINLLDRVDQLRDTQLAECTNFDIDNTGVLEPRRSIRKVSVNSAYTTDTTANYLLGTVTLNNPLDGEFQRAAVGFYKEATTETQVVFIRNPETEVGAAGPLLTGLFKSVVSYLNNFWYVPADATSVGQYTTVTAYGGPTTAVATMPWGDEAFILKDRLFIVRESSSELYFSKATDFTIWAAPDGGVIQVAPGDNNPITKVVVINNQIIIFKRDSTYVLSFTNSPTGDGVLRQISADQGAIDAIAYNNEIYCYNSRSVFKLVNGFFQDIGLQLSLPNSDTIDASATNPAKISVVGKTLIIGITPSGKTYAMNLDTGSWTQYSFAGDLTPSTRTVYSRSVLGTSILYGDGTANLGYMVVTRSSLRRSDQSSSGDYNKPAYSFRTKEYSFDDSEVWKRLYSWHLDSTFDATPEGTALTYINGVQNNSSTDTVDLVGSSLSYRFKTTSLAYSSASAVGDADTPIGPVVRGIRAVIGAKSPVSV